MVTAQLIILDRNQQPVRCRTLIDTCATANFVTENLAKRLGLPRTKCTVPIGALNTLTTVSKHAIKATIQALNNNYERSLTFLTIPEIASSIPDQLIDRRLIKVPKNIKLADPEFHRPVPIDILLGAGTTLSLLCVGQIDLTPSNGPPLYLQKTRLGWVIGGSVPSATPAKPNTFHSNISHLQDDITRFWELEDGPQIRHLSESEKICEGHFKANITRNEDGRYMVALPINEKIDQLGDSRRQAMKRLISLERKLRQDPSLQQQYNSVIQEYLDLGHMSEVTSDNHDGYYLPHHGVIKSTSQTTKLRVVFDGSAKSTTGVSLNDSLHTGPKIQEDLLHILLRFRIHQIVLTGDIEKMYRQFLVRPEDRKFQKIIWRNSNGQINTYQLNTVTFGLSSAPYLAIRCLQQLAEDEKYNFPTAAKILQRDFYVDDLLTGTSTKEEAAHLRKELTLLLKRAGLSIRQWACNDRDLLHDLPEEDVNRNLALGESSTLKTLGIFWNSTNDSIHYAVKTDAHIKQITKRTISSEIAKIYDPLGLLGPVIVTAKILLQKLWTIKVDWDESLPMSVQTEWDTYYRQLPLLNNVAFRRKVSVDSPINLQLHGFCDASEKAYGACVYLRSVDKSGRVHIELLIAKSRVAPLKQQTIPRLELCGALLLVSLVKTVEKSLHISINQQFHWTDSTIVLHWLATTPSTLKTFVVNRVSEIQEATHISKWHHVRTKDNPADMISRGQTAEEFLQPSIWYHGPPWLAENQTHWPTWEPSTIKDLPEQKRAICLITTGMDTSIFDRYSSWEKLVRVVARCLRWRSKTSRKEGLSVVELQHSRNRLIKLLQQQHFADVNTLPQQE